MNSNAKIPIKPNLDILMCLLNACKSNILVVSALIDIYEKYERIHKNQELFDRMHDTNINCLRRYMMQT